MYIIIQVIILAITIFYYNRRIQKLNSKVENLNSTIRDCEIIAAHFGSFDVKIAIRNWDQIWEDQILNDYIEDDEETPREVAYNALSYFQPCPFDDLKSSYFDDFVKEFEESLLIKFPYWRDELKYHEFI